MRYSLKMAAQGRSVDKKMKTHQDEMYAHESPELGHAKV